MKKTTSTTKSILSHVYVHTSIILGSFLAAFALDVIFIPNRLIDGGIVGLAMILGIFFGQNLVPYLFMGLMLPFVYLGYRFIGKPFLLHLTTAFLSFAAFMALIPKYIHFQFLGESLEVVVFGGIILGIGLGIVIRAGGCIDGTEILGVIINRITGITVGQVVLVCNFFVFGGLGLALQDWHPPLLSMIAYMVVIRVMDSVIVGLDETKSVLIISPKSSEIGKAIIHHLKLGVTIMYGRGGFSGKEKEILYVIAERIQLAELKELVYKYDPMAFIAIENIHEVANGNQIAGNGRTSGIKKIVSRIWKQQAQSSSVE